MLSHRRLATWYVQLAQQLEAGLPLAESLRASRGTGAPAALHEAMAGPIDRGGSVDDALRAAGSWLPLPDQLTLSAAAEAGRMPQTLRNLAGRHAQLAATQLRIALACLYPLAILHLGLLLLPVMRMIDWEKGFHWSTLAYVRGVLVTLIPLWIIIGLLIVLGRRQSIVLLRLARMLPALRGYVRAQSLGDLAFAVGNFLEAGVPIGRAWAAAGLITRAPELNRAAEAMAAAVEQGRPPGTRLAEWPCFPPDFAAQYRTGEATGQLEASLLRLSGQYQDAANRALTIATLLYPALMFIVVAAGAAYAILTIYAGYLEMLTKMAE